MLKIKGLGLKKLYYLEEMGISSERDYNMRVKKTSFTNTGFGAKTQQRYNRGHRILHEQPEPVTSVQTN